MCLKLTVFGCLPLLAGPLFMLEFPLFFLKLSCLLRSLTTTWALNELSLWFVVYMPSLLMFKLNEYSSFLLAARDSLFLAGNIWLNFTF